MHPVEFIIAVLLGVFGLVLVITLILFLVRPVIGRVRRGREFSRLRRALEQLEIADDLIEQKRFSEVIPLLRQSVIYDIFSSLDLIVPLREHHQNILSRSLLIAEELGGRLSNIANLERLFLERADLLTLLSQTATRFDRIVEKRKLSGKTMPSWTKLDFQRHTADIRLQLARNEAQLSADLESLFREILAPTSNEITYH